MRLRVAFKRPRQIPVARQFSSSSIFWTSLDSKWIERWKDHPPRKTGPPTKDPYMCLSMFPYPSGIMHVGHLRVYTISDVVARYRRMNNYGVIHAMGWDAFGLPAENAAIQNNVDAADWTYQNIAKMKDQMTQMFADFDWEREVVTCDPEYYRWTQKIFLMMHEAGLAYRKEAEVNWDPIDKTVLANEQVDSEGKSWRSGAKVEKKLLEQWFLGITKYAPQLLKDLDLLDQWPQKVLSMQRNWIGESLGADIKFRAPNPQHELNTFTTRPDTLFGVSYVAVSLNHPVVSEFSSNNPNLSEFINGTYDEDSKAGFQIPGLYVSNPLTPEKYNIPVFAAPYVVGDYGLGAVMGCPSHDIRDNLFWKQNGTEPALSVLDSPEGPQELYTGKDGVLNSNSGKYAGMTSSEGGKAIIADLEPSGLAKSTTKLRLRDWLISRQRFWGAPIPIIHCNTCGTVPVPDKDLPVRLPENNTTPLAHNHEFLETICPSCGGEARRDSDTMDTFMDSSWYFFRYCDPKNTQTIFDFKKASSSMPVDIYFGGIEHAILHLLYSRFMGKFLMDIGAWDGGNMNGEPIKRLVSQGMVQGKTFIEPLTGRFLRSHEIEQTTSGITIKATGGTPLVSYEKMSKSKFNGADPGEVIRAHGADATRAYVLFQGPVEDSINWDVGKIVGVERWIARVQATGDAVVAIIKNHAEGEDFSADELSQQDKSDFNEIQAKIVSITDALHETMSLNTLISDYMKLTRTIMAIVSRGTSSPAFKQYSYSTLLKAIAPVLPVNAEEAWEKLENANGRQWTTIFAQDWPEPRTQLEVQLSVNYSVVLNGKRLFILEHSGNDETELIDTVLKHPTTVSCLDTKKVQKVIVPSGKDTVVIIAK